MRRKYVPHKDIEDLVKKIREKNGEFLDRVEDLGTIVEEKRNLDNPLFGREWTELMGGAHPQCLSEADTLEQSLYGIKNRRKTELFQYISAFYASTKEVLKREYNLSSIRKSLQAITDEEGNPLEHQSQDADALSRLQAIYGDEEVKKLYSWLSCYLIGKIENHFLLIPTTMKIDDVVHTTLGYFYIVNGMHHDTAGPVEARKKLEMACSQIILEFCDPLSFKRLYRLTREKPDNVAVEYIASLLRLAGLARTRGRPSS